MKIMLLTALVLAWLISFPGHAQAQPQLELVNGGFEVFEATATGAPITFTNWGGDLSTIRPAPESGILPRTSPGMFQFLASRTGSAGSQTSCEMFQIVNLDPLRAHLDAGWSITVTQTCYFNRVAGDFQTDTLFESRLDAFDGTPNTFPSRLLSGWLTKASADLFSDSDPATWEQATLRLAIPASATFLVVKITTGEDIFNDTVFPEFDGHFADDVSLTVGIDPPLPRLDIQLMPDGQVMLSWPTVRGFIYQLLRSPSLDSPDWQPFTDPYFGDNFPAFVTGPPVSASSSAYFRLRVTVAGP